MADETLSHAEQAAKAAGDAVVADVIATVRQHPQYAQIVNSLVDKTIQTLMESI